MKTRIVTSAFLLIFGVLIWSAPTVAQGTVHKWIDSDGKHHYSNTPTDEARSIDTELPPATSFGTPAASPSPIAAVSPSGTPPSDEAQARTQGLEADSVDPEGYGMETGEGEFEVAAWEEDFTLGKDGPFGTVEDNVPPLDDY